MSEVKSDVDEWKSAKDPKSGRIYYYNVRTKETTWNKPLQLASDREREEILRKKAETKRFFEEMEANIMRKVREGVQSTNPRSIDGLGGEGKFSGEAESKDNFSRDFDRYGSFGAKMSSSSEVKESNINLPNGGGLRRVLSNSELKEAVGEMDRSGQSGGRLIRTISSIDDELLHMVRPKEASVAENRARTSSRDARFETYLLPNSSSGVINPSKEKSSRERNEPNRRIGLRRRNSTGTIYVGTTMSSQDDKATIQCICIVIREHMVAAAKNGIEPVPEFMIFKDSTFKTKVAIGLKDRKEAGSKSDWQHLVPSTQTVVDFFSGIFSKSQMESECIIMALIYCERLVKQTKGRLCIRFDNWRPILFACMVMASKVWDDLSMWNIDFSNVCPSFDLRRVNELECAMLEALSYEVRVTAGEYAKYYFHLRSMMARLGFHANEANVLRPLDIEGAQRLQLSTESYQQKNNDYRSMRRRVVSAQDGLDRLQLTRGRTTDGYDFTHHASVGLEQLIHDGHHDADGLTHTSHNNSNSSQRNSFNLLSGGMLNSILATSPDDYKLGSYIEDGNSFASEKRGLYGGARGACEGRGETSELKDFDHRAQSKA